MSLLEKNIASIIKITNVYAHTVHDRQDLANDIIYELWKSFPRFRGEAKVSTWIYRVALNVSLSATRKKKNNRVVFIDELSASDKNTLFSSPGDKTSDIGRLYECIERCIRIDKALLFEKMNLAMKDIKRKNLLRLTCGFALLPLVFGVILYPHISAYFRNDASFYGGIFLLTAPIIVGFGKSIVYNKRLRKIDLTAPLAETQKGICDLKIYRIKMMKTGWIRVLSAAAGFFLIFRIPLTTDACIVISVTLLLTGIVTFWDIKYRVPGRFRELKSFLSFFEEKSDGQ